ncbi:MAG TPA: nucleoside-diphosphate sugar epimerase/dehydratase [Gemmatimonadaceae bacterium]|nr:nucleoside-diphosphate sugar epimerase/dehydratase [Gemmatimonadaceae bacterium]
MGRLRNRHLLLLDAALIAATAIVAYALRFEGFNWSRFETSAALLYTALSVVVWIGVLLAAGLYRRLWRHASVVELEHILLAGLSAGAVCFALGAIVIPGLGISQARVPLSVLSLHVFFALTVVAAPRMALRVLGARSQRRRRSDDRRALVVGAGAAGQLIARELLAHPQLGLNPIGFVDDDPRTHNLRLHDRPVFGPLSDIPEVVHRHDVGEIVIAMPSAPGHVVREVLRLAQLARVPTRTVPGLYEILSGRVGVSSLRQVQIEDLLRREPVRTDLASVRALVVGRTVLVTGAGGSIGSELCRQLAQLDPGTLVVLGHGENSIFTILHELREQFPGLAVVPVIADVRDRMRIRRVFEQHAPQVVFHAAAHKHVPLMEHNVVEAITNNVQGTRNVADAAAAVGTEHFVLISTDKAVRPTSVMGASKRAAELVVQSAAAASGRNFVSVRFGNVLGSRGSVVPTFLRQIRAGGPVTVTHPEMRRYFMTIPESVQLVLQAAALGRGGEVFVLDMGDPVRIIDLATDLVRLSGLEVGTDIEIRCTGVRPGEKLYEEMFFSEENATPTEHPKVLRARNAVASPDVASLIDDLIDATETGAKADRSLRQMLASIVPDYVPDGSPAAVPDAPADEDGDEDERAAQAPAAGMSTGAVVAPGNGQISAESSRTAVSAPGLVVPAPAPD